MYRLPPAMRRAGTLNRFTRGNPDTTFLIEPSPSRRKTWTLYSLAPGRAFQRRSGRRVHVMTPAAGRRSGALMRVRVIGLEGGDPGPPAGTWTGSAEGTVALTR